MWPFSRRKALPPVTVKLPDLPRRQSGVFTLDGYSADEAAMRRAQMLERILPRQQTAKFAMDSAKDAFAISQGNGMPELLLDWYGSQSFIGHQMCAILAQHWLIEKCCSMPARDSVRKGWEVTVNGESDEGAIAKILAADRKYRLDAKLIEYGQMARVFGIRIAMFQIDGADDEFYRKPFNIDSVRPGSYKGFSQVDPYWCAPMLDREASSQTDSQHFYEPTWWVINGRQVHRSHLVIYVPHQIPDVLKPTYIYGGPSVPQRIYERVYGAERTANEAPHLAMSKRMDVLYTDTTQALSNECGFSESLSLWRRLMDNFHVKVADKESEKIERFDTSLTDLDSVIMTQYQLVAAVAGVPATKLLGTQPKGFNATGESEEASYHEELESIQTHGLMPLLEHHYRLLCKSAGFGFEVQPVFCPLDSMTERELAEVNKMKAETAVALAGIGAIDGIDERKRISTDDQSGYNGIDVTEDPGMDPVVGEAEE